MRKMLALWLFSLGAVAAVTSALTIVVVRRTIPPTLRVPDALPWSMGAKSVVKGPNDSTYARGAFINLPVSCDVFSPSQAIVIADEVIISRVPDTRQDFDAELRGNVHIRYTVLHD